MMFTFFQKPVVEVEELTTLPVGQYTLATKGILSCVAVCIQGKIKNFPYFAMAHILADPNELDTAINTFDSIEKLHVIGGTDDWYGRALFHQIKSKLECSESAQVVDYHFNPCDITENDTGPGADVIFDGDSVSIIAPHQSIQNNKV